MIWHEWEGINLEPAHNSQLLFWPLRSEQMQLMCLLNLSWEIWGLIFGFNFSRNINQIKPNDKFWPVYKSHALYLPAGKIINA